MKDKLVKSGHFGLYYKVRRAGRVLVVTFALAIFSALPVVIAYGVSSTQALAEEATSEVETSESSATEIASYNP